MKNDYEKLMNKLGAGFDQLSNTVNRNGLASIRQTQQTETALKQHLSTTADRLSDTVNRNGLASIRQTQQSEAALSKKIDCLKSALTTGDYIVILIVTIIFGVIAYFFSMSMVDLGMGAWAYTEVARDAAGNLIQGATTVKPVWQTIAVTIAIFSILGMTLSHLVLSDRAQRRDI